MFLKISDYEDTVRQLDIYYGIGEYIFIYIYLFIFNKTLTLFTQNLLLKSMLSYLKNDLKICS